MPVIKLPPDFKPDNRSNIANLHSALTSLKLAVDPTAVAEKKIESTTKDAIKKIQKENKIRVTGNLDAKTIAALNTELNDRFITGNKYRTAELHELLDKLKINVNEEEKGKRISGDSTRKAIAEFQKKERLPVTGKISEEVIIKMQEKVIKNRFYSPAKNQRGVLQTTLQKVSKISKLNLGIDPDEIKKKKLGTTSVKVIKAFQQKYNLPVTGTVDKATFDKINSVAASKGTFVKKL
jgi:peptidoglycan hydrolase-like protein with peptidoglycan-binding domain